MIYGYARVSTQGQAREGNSLDDQEIKLSRAGAEVIYKDAFTGTKKDRPELDKLLAVIGEGDTLVVCKLDRVARSIQVGVELIDELVSKGVTVNILNLGVLDNTPAGKLMRNVFLAFAEFERDMIVERTQEGKKIAREKNPNFKEGRPSKYDEVLNPYKQDYLEGKIKIKEIISITGINMKTVYNYCNRWNTIK